MSAPVPKDWEAGAGWGPWAVLLRRTDAAFRHQQATAGGRLIAGWFIVAALAIQLGVAWFVRRDVTPLREPELANLGLVIVAAGLALVWATVAGLTLRVPWFGPLGGVVVGCLAAHVYFYFGVVPIVGEGTRDPHSLFGVAKGGVIGGIAACFVGIVVALLVTVPLLWTGGLRESNERSASAGLDRPGAASVRPDLLLDEGRRRRRFGRR